MSLRIMERVWRLAGLSVHERMVLLCLADHADDDGGNCYPPVTRICERTSLTERGVQSVIKRLRDAGHLTIEAGGGRGISNLYRVHPTAGNPAPETGFEDEKPRTGNPVSEVETPHPTTETPHLTAINPAPGAPQLSLTVKEEKNPHSPPSSSPDFATVWRAYPRKVGKGAAERAWERVTRKTPVATIAPALGAFIRSTRGTDPQFIPHLATWLNQSRWEDDPGHARNRPRSSAEDIEGLATISAAEDTRRLFAEMPPLLRIVQ